jgi:hypothetical protein
MFTEDVQMSALGQRRTYAAHKLMSAFPPIATAKADMPHEALVSLVCASGATDGTKCATPGTAATASQAHDSRMLSVRSAPPSQTVLLTNWHPI